MKVYIVRDNSGDIVNVYENQRDAEDRLERGDLNGYFVECYEVVASTRKEA